MYILLYDLILVFTYILLQLDVSIPVLHAVLLAG